MDAWRQQQANLSTTMYYPLLLLKYNITNQELSTRIYFLIKEDFIEEEWRSCVHHLFDMTFTLLCKYSSE